jgi:hypothetical protein
MFPVKQQFWIIRDYGLISLEEQGASASKECFLIGKEKWNSCG